MGVHTHLHSARADCTPARRKKLDRSILAMWLSEDAKSERILGLDMGLYLYSFSLMPQTYVYKHGCFSISTQNDRNDH